MKRFATLAAILALAAPALAVQTVGPGGTHSSIPAALAVAAPGEEIRVRFDHQEFLTTIVTQSQQIISVDAAYAAPQPGATLFGGLDVNMSSVPTVVVEGCTINGPGGRVNIGLFAGAGTLTLEDCAVTGLDHALTLFGDADGATINVTNCTFNNVEFHAFQIFSTCTLNITGSDIGPAGFDGIFLTDQAGPDPTVISLDASTVREAGFGIVLDAPASLDLSNASEVRNNRITGVDVRPNAAGSSLVWSDSSISDNQSVGFYTNAAVTASLDGMQISRNRFEGVILDGGSAGSEATMTDCTLDANGQHGEFGDGIRINGAVELDLLRTEITNGVSTNGDGIFVLGGGALTDLSLVECTISGNGRNGLNTDATLSTVVLSGTSFDNNGGSGLATNINANGLDLGTVTNCTFNGNALEGAQFLRSVSATFVGCEFSSNGFAGLARFIVDPLAPGANPALPTSLALDGCDLLGNGTRALTLSDAATTAVVEDCVLENGTLGALHSNNESGETISFVARRAVLRDTQAGAAPLVDMTGSGDAQTRLENCVLDTTGTAVTLAGSTLAIDHCTLVSTGAGTGLVVDAASSAALTRSIVDGFATAASVAAGATFSESHNLLDGALDGFALDATSLAGLDPLFVTASSGPGTGDFMLQPSSPAAGLASLGLGEDFTGGPRPLPAGAPGSDAGAFEVSEATNVSDWLVLE